MPNTSQQSQPQTPGSYSGYEVMPAAEVVMFEKPLIVEAQTSPEVFPTPITEPTPIRTIQKGLPLSSFGGEITSLDTFERKVAERASHVSTGVTWLRSAAVDKVWSEQGLRRAA